MLISSAIGALSLTIRNDSRRAFKEENSLRLKTLADCYSQTLGRLRIHGSSPLGAGETDADVAPLATQLRSRISVQVFAENGADSNFQTELQLFRGNSYNYAEHPSHVETMHQKPIVITKQNTKVITILRLKATAIDSYYTTGLIAQTKVP